MTPFKNPSTISSHGHTGQCGYSPTIACSFVDLDKCPEKCDYYWYYQNCRLWPSEDRTGQKTLEEFA